MKIKNLFPYLQIHMENAIMPNPQIQNLSWRGDNLETIILKTEFTLENNSQLR